MKVAAGPWAVTATFTSVASYAGPSLFLMDGAVRKREGPARMPAIVTGILVRSIRKREDLNSEASTWVTVLNFLKEMQKLV